MGALGGLPGPEKNPWIHRPTDDELRAYLDRHLGPAIQAARDTEPIELALCTTFPGSVDNRHAITSGQVNTLFVMRRLIERIAQNWPDRRIKIHVVVGVLHSHLSPTKSSLVANSVRLFMSHWPPSSVDISVHRPVTDLELKASPNTQEKYKSLLDSAGSIIPRVRVQLQGKPYPEENGSEFFALEPSLIELACDLRSPPGTEARPLLSVVGHDRFWDFHKPIPEILQHAGWCPEDFLYAWMRCPSGDSEEAQGLFRRALAKTAPPVDAREQEKAARTLSLDGRKVVDEDPFRQAVEAYRSRTFLKSPLDAWSRLHECLRAWYSDLAPFLPNSFAAVASRISNGGNTEKEVRDAWNHFLTWMEQEQLQHGVLEVPTNGSSQWASSALALAGVLSNPSAQKILSELARRGGQAYVSDLSDLVGKAPYKRAVSSLEQHGMVRREGKGDNTVVRLIFREVKFRYGPFDA